MTVLLAEVTVTAESNEIVAGSFEKESDVGKCSLGTEHCALVFA
jgi:hypothetical protein